MTHVGLHRIFPKFEYTDFVFLIRKAKTIYISIIRVSLLHSLFFFFASKPRFPFILSESFNSRISDSPSATVDGLVSFFSGVLRQSPAILAFDLVKSIILVLFHISRCVRSYLCFDFVLLVCFRFWFTSLSILVYSKAETQSRVALTVMPNSKLMI